MEEGVPFLTQITNFAFLIDPLMFNINLTRLLVTPLLVIMCMYVHAQEVRTYDGSDNNLENPSWGSSHTPLLRYAAPDFADGINEPKLDETYGRPNPRVISNVLFAQEQNIIDETGLSDYAWVFGQFIDHDLMLVENSEEFSDFLPNIVVPEDDEYFLPGQIIRMVRSKKAEGTGITVQSPRNNINEISAFLDGSAIYGSDQDRADWLRTFSKGKLKVSSGDLLPWNTVDGEFNSAIDKDAPFMADDTHMLTKMQVAGDVRANENPLLLSMHTLFVREHNRLCDVISEQSPAWTDELIYQKARAMNIGILQRITFEEWLPALGIVLPTYSGYQDDVDPSISNVVSASAFRIGHTLINSNIIRLDNSGMDVGDGSITLRDAFFNPLTVIVADGIEPFLKGMGVQVQQKLDCKVVNDVRNFLFGAPGSGGLDLASININRGRERGIPGYNDLRAAMGLPRFPSFVELTQDADEARVLESVYGDINNVDSWVGMLAEVPLQESIMGRLMHTILSRQFRAVRDGDRFYFEIDPSLTASEVAEINSTSMRDVIMRNTNITLMQDNVFSAMPHEDIISGPQPIPEDLNATMYPVPISSDYTLNVYSDKEQTATVKWIDANARIVKTETVSLVRGVNTVYGTVAPSMPFGFYNVLIETPTSFYLMKAIIQ